MILQEHAGPLALALLFGLGQAACSGRGSEDAAPAPIDSGEVTGAVDTTVTPAGNDTVPAPGTDTMLMPGAADTGAAGPDTSMATPPIIPVPPDTGRDSAPAGAARPSGPGSRAGPGQGSKVSTLEYEGWRQYSVNCARCHGQDALPNPVAANLLVSLGPGGPIDSTEKFVQVVGEGRPERGMPPFKNILTADQISAVYAYLKGRAESRIPPGRPGRPQA